MLLFSTIVFFLGFSGYFYNLAGHDHAQILPAVWDGIRWLALAIALLIVFGICGIPNILGS